MAYNQYRNGMLIFIIKGYVSGLMNPIALDNIDWRYYIIWTCWILVEVIVIYFLFPETRH